MTLQTSQAAEMNLQAEIDRLTCSAYLLTLDPAMALSVVMAALDWSSEEVACTTFSDVASNLLSSNYAFGPVWGGTVKVQFMMRCSVPIPTR